MAYIKFFSLIVAIGLALLWSPIRSWIQSYQESAPIAVAEKEQFFEDFLKKSENPQEKFPVASLEKALQVVHELGMKQKEIEVRKRATEWFLKTKEYPKATLHGEKYLDLSEKFSLADEKQKALLLLSKLFLARGELEEKDQWFQQAKIYSLKGLEREKETGFIDPKVEGHFCLILGKIAFNTNLKESLSYFERAERHLFHDAEYPSIICALAKIHLLNGDATKASKILNQIKESAIQDKNLFSEIVCLQAEVFAAEGDLSKAYEEIKKVYFERKNVSKTQEKKITALFNAFRNHEDEMF